ncbi:hypothetical protein UVUMRFZT_CDS0079 [Staphylococcus phage LJLAME001]
MLSYCYKHHKYKSMIFLSSRRCFPFILTASNNIKKD